MITTLRSRHKLGRVAVGQFMETLGYKLNDAHHLFTKVDHNSILKLTATRNRHAPKVSKDGKEVYDSGKFALLK